MKKYISPGVFIALGIVFVIASFSYSYLMIDALGTALVAVLGFCGVVNIVTGGMLLRIRMRR